MKGEGKRQGKNVPKVCPEYLTPAGCADGAQCRGHHPPTSGKCLKCGSTSHWVKGCPRPKRAQASQTAAGAHQATEEPEEEQWDPSYDDWFPNGEPEEQDSYPNWTYPDYEDGQDEDQPEGGDDYGGDGG